MTSAQHTRGALARTYVLALLGNAALLLLGWAWLYIPDSHAWQFLFAMLLALLILAGFLALHVTLVQRLYPAVHRKLALACVILFGWLALGFLLHHLAAHLAINIETRAGYWNSQLSPHHRATFTYERLVRWQELALQGLQWILIPGLLLPFAVETVSRTQRPWQAALAALRRPELWLTVFLAYVGGSCLGDHLLTWHPTYSVHGEVVSVLLRSALVYCMAVALLVATLLVVALLLTRIHERRDASTQPAAH